MAYRAAWRGAFRRIVYNGGPGAAGQGLHRNGTACRGEGIRLCRSEVSARAERWICEPLRLSHADEWLRRRGWAERSRGPRVRSGRGWCSHHADPPPSVRWAPGWPSGRAMEWIPEAASSRWQTAGPYPPPSPRMEPTRAAFRASEWFPTPSGEAGGRPCPSLQPPGK